MHTSCALNDLYNLNQRPPNTALLRNSSDFGGMCHLGRFLTVAARKKHHLWPRAVYTLDASREEGSMLIGTLTEGRRHDIPSHNVQG